VSRKHMLLSAGSIPLLVFCQAIAHNISFAHSTPAVNLLLTFALLIGTAGALTLWLGTHPQRKPAEVILKPRGKKNRHNSVR